MDWEEIKKDNQKIYPENSMTTFIMNTEKGNSATHWVDKAYKDYSYKSYCPYNCLITVNLSNEFNLNKSDLDIESVEKYFKDELRKVCVCHFLARITTEDGFNLELYVDDVENALDKLTELESDPNRAVNFDCEITDDREWETIGVLLN